MKPSDDLHEVHLGAQGRLVIPARVRRALDLKPGDALIVRSEADRLVVEKAEAVKRRLRERFGSIPHDIDMADELIEHRRREALRETPE